MIVNPAVDSEARSSLSKTLDESIFPAVCTLVLWTSCAIVGSLGLVLSYQRPSPPSKPAPPIQAELLNVELTSDPIPSPEIPQPSALTEPPTLMEVAAPVQAPALVAVATPTPAVAFALPVEGPTRVVEASQASFARSTVPAESIASAPTLPVQSLTYGHGEGKQPAPDYPVRARREGQEGTVLVRFSVGENGRVLTAEAAGPTPWSLLNESAVKTVRERWRFPRGAMRVYEVAIRFELAK